MEILPWRRLRQVWLTCIALVLGMPWLVFTGTGLCPLAKGSPAAGAATAHTIGNCCQRCCSVPIAASTPSTPAPEPTQVMTCCEVFRAYLPLAAGGSQIKWLAAPGNPLVELPASDRFSPFTWVGIPTLDGRCVVVAGSEGLPSTFLQTVARRCHPAHAPPLAVALLS